MRVLAFSDHLSEQSSGGAERVAAQVYGRLAARGDVELTVVSVVRPGHRCLDVPGARVVGIPGTDLSGVVGAEMLLARGLGRAARELHAQVRPDVLHANGLHFHGSAVAAGTARRTGTPLVTTAHLGDLSALRPWLRVGGTVWDATIGARVVRSSRTVVAVSASVATHVASLGGRSTQTVVAPNGVDHASYHDRDRRPLRDHGPLRAVFVGRLVDNKGPHVAVDALARARAAGADVTLDVLGDGPMRRALQATVEARHLGGSVRFLGHVDDVAARLRQADVLLRPSFTEGLPLAVLEAMACGVPVVCSTVPGNTEVVADGVHGLHCRTGSAADVAAALGGLAADRETLRRLGAAATRAAADHTWERSADVHADALEGRLQLQPA